MADYIDRGSIMRTAHILRPEDKELMSAISSIPAADVAPVRHGRWIKTIEENEDEDYPIRNILYICSECKTRELSERNYCPCCGSRMDGAE